MPLSVAKVSLEQAIKQAFLTINDSGAQDGSNPDANIANLASALTDAIHSYVTAASVDITTVVSTVPPGVVVTAGIYPGATVSPGVAQHAGFGKLV